MSKKDKFKFKFNQNGGKPNNQQNTNRGPRDDYEDDGGDDTHEPLRYVVTGGAGFVGARLVRALQEKEPTAEIIVVDDFRSGTFANLSIDGPSGWSFKGEIIARSLSGELDWYIGDFLEDFQPDVVFHLASITDTTVADEKKMMRDNVEPFVTMLYLATELNFKLVYASSAATYGISANGAMRERRPFRIDDAGRPANVYGFSKWTMENVAARTIATRSDAHIVGLRYFNVFGPGEAHKKHMASMIYQLAQQMLAGKTPRIFTPGEQARDQVHVDDVVAATIAASVEGVRPGVYNVGSGKVTTFNQIIAALNEAFGTSVKPEYFENPYKFYQDYTCADLTLSTQFLRWSPKHDSHKAMVDYARQLKAAGL